PQTVDLIGSEATHRLDHVVLREVDEPLDLHGDAIAIEGRLGEMIDEVSGVFAVATVKRSESDGWRDIGKGNSRHGPIFSCAAAWGGTRPLGCASEARSIQGTAVVRAHLSVFACGNDGDSDACALWTLEGCPQPPDRAFSSGSDPAYSQGHR